LVSPKIICWAWPSELYALTWGPMLKYERTTEHLLDIQNVGLKFGKKTILRDINASITNVTRPDVKQGQVIAFLGPSGRGKTQLSRIIAGLKKPTSGTVTLGNGVPAHKGGVGMVPQNYPLFDFLTVWDNLMLAGKQGGLSKQAAQEKATDFGQQLGIMDYAHMYPQPLSGGTKQRVAIVRQLMCADHYLVMDEPFSGLDPTTKKATARLIVQLSEMDDLNTIIIVTHDVKTGLSVADTAWLLGFEGDPQNPGQNLPGSRLVETHDLAEEGFAWHENITKDHDFLEFVGHIEDRFDTL
jgi:ABC-type nitrate/sulfonate/bicarbonate transport system ATPase subunit